MKKLFSFAFVMTALCCSQAFATYDNCLCWTNINVNTGHTSRSCNDDSTAGSGCECTTASISGACQATVRTGSCASGETSVGKTATQKTCCVTSLHCLTDGQEQQSAQEVQSNSNDESLANVFDGSRTSVFFAYVDSVLRSPNAGRTLLMDAKVDACIGWSNFNSLISAYPNDPYGAWSACTGSGYCGSVKNAYCTNNSNQVCLDRCNCKYQSALVGLGYPDPGCSNL